jgi:hypothetical protein
MDICIADCPTYILYIDHYGLLAHILPRNE